MCDFRIPTLARHYFFHNSPLNANLETSGRSLWQKEVFKDFAANAFPMIITLVWTQNIIHYPTVSAPQTQEGYS